MKYVWIIILGIVYLIWLIAVVKDIVETVKLFKLKWVLIELEDYSKGFLLIHLFILFGYSVYMWFAGS